MVTKAYTTIDEMGHWFLHVTQDGHEFVIYEQKLATLRTKVVVFSEGEPGGQWLLVMLERLGEDQDGFPTYGSTDPQTLALACLQWEDKLPETGPVKIPTIEESREIYGKFRARNPLDPLD